MKASSKSHGGIKGMFLAHGEKLGMALVAIAALFLVYKAMQQQSLDASHQPTELERLVTEAKGTVEKADFATAPDENKRTFKEIAKVGDTTIRERAYHASVNWNPPVVPPTVLRKDPVLLAAQKLEANGGSGFLAFTNDDIRRQRALEEQQAAERKAMAQQKEQQKEADQTKTPRANNAAKNERGGRGDDPDHPNRRLVTGMAKPAGIPTAGDEEIRTAYWAVVLAKVPIKDEYKLYKDAFENARGYVPEADIPRYLGYRVKRAEVLPGKELKDDDFQPVSVYNGKGELISAAVYSLAIYGQAGDDAAGTKPKRGMTTDWAAQSEEIVDPRYLDDSGVLAVPLPPLVGRDWGAEVTHSEIPLASKATDTEEEAAKPADDNQVPKAQTPAEEDFSASDPNAAGGQRGRAPMMRGGGGEGERGSGRGYPGGYGGGRAAMSERGEGREAYAPRGGARGSAGGDMSPEVPCWLLRFFDFSVEPGKKYKYKVQLVIHDPNQSSETGRLVSTDSLDAAAITRIKAEKAAKKKPFRVTDWSDPSPTVSIPLAGDVHVAAAKPASDRFNDEPSTTLLVESFGKDDKQNGIQSAKEKDFKRGSVANMTEDGEVLVEQGRAIDPIKNFPFHTGITVLDIDGGDQLAKDVKKPARVLLMDQAGQLFVQNETDDADAVQLHRDIFADADKQQRGRPGAPTGGRENPRGPGGSQPGFGGRGGGGER
jgi:hypothetical protein